MALKLSNNASGILAAAISNSATSLTLRSGHGSRFPALSSGDWFPITVVRASDPSQFEIMRCTARNGDTLTVVRAQEGTSAITFSAGDVVELRLTAGTLEENFPQVEGRNAKNLRFIISSVGGKPELKFKSGNNEETVVRLSDLGTAATRDVTTSRTDTTAGRLLKFGDFGVGYSIDIPQGANLNDYTTQGEYRQNMNANATPELNYPAQLAGALKVMNVANGVIQEYTTFGSTRRKFLRGLYDVVWSGWVEFYSSGNDASLVKTSRTISTGTGLTGGGDLSANRTISLASSHWPIGVGQTWQDVTAQRALNTTYTNSTGRTIVVSIVAISGRDSYAAIYVDGKLIFHQRDTYNGADPRSSAVAIVPPGSTYRVSSGNYSGTGVSLWMELR